MHTRPRQFALYADSTMRAVEIKHSPTESEDLMSLPGTGGSTEFPYRVKKVAWRGHTKRLHLDPGNLALDVPLSACVTTGDQLRVDSGDVWVTCKNGDCKILQPYVIPDTINLGGVQVEVLVKEVTEHDEHLSYRSLADYHYRNKSIHGRTARLIRTHIPSQIPQGARLHRTSYPFFHEQAKITHHGCTIHGWKRELDSLGYGHPSKVYPRSCPHR